jgi:hypothetical protein
MKPHVFTWLSMPQLPKIPEHFVQRARTMLLDLEDQNSATLKQGYTNSEFQRRLIQRNGEQLPTVYSKAVRLGDDWNAWLKDNKFPDFFDSTARFTAGAGDVFGPHVDNPGRVRLFYLVDRGGESAETVWYHRSGDPVVYDMDNHNSNEIIHHNNVNELTVLDRAQFPLNTWTLFNGWIMHGVENVTDTRFYFTVDMHPSAFDLSIVSKSAG